jgi:DNA (cytosine-5)-methyltransferase 1
MSLKVMTKNKKNIEIKNDQVVIPNHQTSSLSDLDMVIVKSVPPGGNWKNLPDNIPSNRIKQIRASFIKGEGSRSTYYGRLSLDKPSYTINTYFNRPGNGCHIHYAEDRVISQREAARLQSFPDSFIFLGSQNSINNQIGNAVPPLLAFQIALQISNTIGQKGFFVDLFSGAGGMGLGFKWAGWEPVLANDIDKIYLSTYSTNVHNEVLVGSITDQVIFTNLVERTLKFKRKHKNFPFWVLGGPPCQGFSTAGNKRSMEDKRNQLFNNYVDFLSLVKPDGFVFENVAGILNIEKGKVFEKIKSEFKNVMPEVNGFTLNSENYAIPQRRKRVFLIGHKNSIKVINPPQILTTLKIKYDLFNSYHKCVNVVDAISDLPALVPGQNGSSLNYRHAPRTNYQKLMRGKITPDEYLKTYS